MLISELIRRLRLLLSHGRDIKTNPEQNGSDRIPRMFCG